jgi:hypothetical protein
VENLLRPWILALLLASGGAAFAWLRGLAIAASVLRRFRHDDRHEAQIQLERRAELGARWIELGALSSAASFGILVLGAGHAASEIRGAMCAHGVLASTSVGFLAVGLGLAVFVAGIIWSQLHRLDLELREPLLTRPKFLAFVLLAPLAVASAAVNLVFVSELDFGVVATCCSAAVDSVEADSVSTQRAAPIAFPLHVAALLVAAAVSAGATRRPSRWGSLLAGGLALIALAAAIPALVHYVAPHVYETPNHRCPFCLLRGPEAAVGLPTYAAMAVALFSATSLLVRVSDPRWVGEADAVTVAVRRRGLITAVALVTLTALLLFPVVRYHLITGGASLFGAAP